MYRDVDRDETVVYDPPKSVAFGHQSRIRNARVAWSKTLAFLNEFTRYRLQPYISLDCDGVNDATSEEVSSERLATARGSFGPEKNPSTVPRHTRSWELELAQLPAAIEFALDDDKWPRQAGGPVMLFFRYELLWRQLLASPIDSDDELQRLPQGVGWSTMGVILGSQRLFLQPYLAFPFHYASPGLAAFLLSIEEKLPFRFRDQYFKRSLRPVGKKAGRVLKLDKSWRQPHLGSQQTPESGPH
jgi:hypothetical protein